MAYNKLRFFDSESNSLNLKYNSDRGIWEGNCYLPEVSTGLYETLTIYILEEVKSNIGSTDHITPISENPGISKFNFKFISGYDFSNDIFLYGSKDINGRSEIEILEELNVDLLDASTSTGVDSNGFKIVGSNLPLVPVKCNVALMSEHDHYHTRVLSITEVDALGNETALANIRIYGETVEEDERLGVLLSNIGMTLSPEDYIILRDSNINEISPDWILMNQKRKELLLEASQIKPFIGTYKALLRAIDFFGYDKLTLNEYWLNVNEQSENFGKLKAVSVPGQDNPGFLANKSNSSELPNSNHKKTSRFSLAYRLNVADGGVDEWDIPTTKEISDYTPDEVLIKLYGLKKKLQKDFLPLQAKIVDITGEGDYFAQFNINVWNNQHTIKVQEAGSDISFSVFPKTKQLYIEDLRKVDYRLTGIGQDFTNISNTLREDLVESITGFYSGYYNTNMATFNTLTGIPIGCPIVLNADSFIDSWDSAEFTFNDADRTGNHMITWDTWWRRGVYEIEWVITGPNGYMETYKGAVGYYDNAGVFYPEYQQIPAVLPYTGKYTVELAVLDLYNVRSSFKANDFFEVKSKGVEIYGLYQRQLPQLNWNQYRYDWDVAGSDWDWSRENTAEIDSIIATYYLTLDRANYVNDSEDGVEFSTVRRYEASTPTGFAETTGPYQWKELKQHTWNDGPQVNWDMMRVGPDINSSFKVDLAQSNGFGILNPGTIIMTQVDPVTNLTVTDSYLINATYPVDNTDLVAWNNIGAELNSLNPFDHPLLSKFNYNPVLYDNNNDGTPDECEYILAVAEEPSRTHDFKTVGFTTPTGGLIFTGSEVHFTSYNPDFNDICIVDSHTEIHMLNHLTFSYDTTKMPGIISQEWVLKNRSQNVGDIYYNNTWLTYLFSNKGEYEIELELTDVNGNKNKTNKNILKII